jgi:hypothetical protein
MHGEEAVPLVGEQVGLGRVWPAQLFDASLFDVAWCLVEPADAVQLLPAEVSGLIEDV